VTSSSTRPPVRGWRWPLRPLEWRLDAELETAKLELARLHQEERVRSAAAQQRNTVCEQQQKDVSEWLVRAPHMRSHALSHLAEVERSVREAKIEVKQAQDAVAVCRDECLRLQRQFACVQRLRETAERSHHQEQLRRDAREADASWLARAGQASLLSRTGTGR
jgi:hypothetical protein